MAEKDGVPCCPRFGLDEWDENEIVWENKLFIRRKTSNFFHSAPDFSELLQKVKDAGALPKQLFMLSEDSELWSTTLYVAISKAIPGEEIVKISGRFIVKVYEGPYSDAGKWLNKTQEYVKTKKKKVRSMYFFYTHCPKCNEYYGNQYTAVLAEID